MAELKTKKNDASVEEFLASISDEEKRRDAETICKIMQDVTGEKPKMWGSSIVGFGTYTYKYSSGRTGDWMRVGFSPRKQNLTIYIMPGFDLYAEASGYDPKLFLDKLGKFSTGKSCLYIKRLADVDQKVLTRLIAKSDEVMQKLYP